MIYGYAQVSTGGQSEAAQVRQLRAAGAKKVFREVASGAKTGRAQLRRLLDQLVAGDVVLVTRLDRLARSTFYLFATVKRIVDAKALAELACSYGVGALFPGCDEAPGPLDLVSNAAKKRRSR
jgi:DNA invertase Pin-like site-specific DNA recombinase